MSEPKPKVSVVMITYNHEKFIEQAVNSVLMQETDFDYEIIIGEDCSTDRTREILVELQKQHPDKIRLVLNPQNLGMMRNFANILDMARGEYVALLEGDDYWTSSRKLQIQIDQMDVHLEWRLCVHAVEVVYEGRPDLQTTVRRPKPNAPTGVEGVQGGAHTHTSAVVFRQAGKMPEWLRNLRGSGDWAILTWLLLQGGEFGYVPGPPMSVYRRNEGGITFNSGEKRWLDMIDDVFVFMKNLEKPMTFWQHKLVFHPVLFGRHVQLSRIYIAEGNLPKARYHSTRALYYAPFRSSAVRKALRLIAQSYAPNLYKAARSVKSRLW